MPTRDRIARSSVPTTLAALGDGWTLLLLTALVGGPRRFSTLESALGVPRSTLAARLRHMEEHGLVAREVYDERPMRFEYALTERGVIHVPLARAMARKLADPAMYLKRHFKQLAEHFGEEAVISEDVKK